MKKFQPSLGIWTVGFKAKLDVPVDNSMFIKNVSLIKVRCWVSLRRTTSNLGYNQFTFVNYFKLLNYKDYI